MPCMPVACTYHLCPLNENHFQVAEWMDFHSNVALGGVIF